MGAYSFFIPSLSLFQVELLVMKALSLGLVKGRHYVGKGKGGQGLMKVCLL